MNYNTLAKVLKYTLASDEDFKRAIYAEPAEAHHSLVYADWLDEQNRGLEAEFHRNMGWWKHREPLKKDKDSTAYMSTDLAPRVRPEIHAHPYWVSAHKSQRDKLPVGVVLEHIPLRWLENLHPSRTTISTEDEVTQPSDYPEGYEKHHALYDDYLPSISLYRWKTYKDMEDSFWDSFRVEKNRQKRVNK